MSFEQTRRCLVTLRTSPREEVRRAFGLEKNSAMFWGADCKKSYPSSPLKTRKTQSTLCAV
jgi:hypothetical protein